MNDYKAKIEAILDNSAIHHNYDRALVYIKPEVCTSLLQLIIEAKIEELEQIDAYPARTIWMPDLNKPSEEIKWVAAEDIKGYQQNRLAELKGEK